MYMYNVYVYLNTPPPTLILAPLKVTVNLTLHNVVCTCRCSVSFSAHKECIAILSCGQKSAVHIQRIYPNEDFWLEKVSKVKQFFATAILPKLVGKFYSRNTDVVLCSSEPPSEHTSEPGPSSDEETDTKVYCYCQSAERAHSFCTAVKRLSESKKYCQDCHPSICRLQY